MHKYSLFSVIGLEIEYMIVDKTSLQVLPISDVILENIAHTRVNETSLGSINASNELVLHVLELKNAEPAPLSPAITTDFQRAIRKLWSFLDANNAILLPTSAHPFMDPAQETQRWPHDNQEIYQQYDTIFNCKGHGWSNVQSVHINLPFANDTEFSLLHAAIRLLLPLIPAIAASSPILEGKKTGHVDTRLLYYGENQAIIPEITGGVIPPSVTSQHAYETTILAPMYAAIAPYDTSGILQHPWLNSRGAIPKFDVGAIEIRLMDTQECVRSDLAIVSLIHAILQHWIAQDALAGAYDTQALQKVYQTLIRDGFDALVKDTALLSFWSGDPRPKTAHTIWHMLIESVANRLDSATQKILEQIMTYGNLSTRIVQALPKSWRHADLVACYRDLSHCLYHNQLFPHP